VQAASVLVCCGFCCFTGASTILVPSNVVFVKTKRIPIGNNSDLYPRWLGAREALLHNQDPYSTAVTREIQLGLYLWTTTRSKQSFRSKGSGCLASSLAKLTAGLLVCILSVLLAVEKRSRRYPSI
jgi:hypothetical protein